MIRSLSSDTTILDREVARQFIIESLSISTHDDEHYPVFDGSTWWFPLRRQHLSTFDTNMLTRLVVMAHEQKIRLQLAFNEWLDNNKGNYIGLSACDKHPTLLEHYKQLTGKELTYTEEEPT